MRPSTAPTDGAPIDDDLDALPPSLPAMWRTVKLGYRSEPKLLLWSFAMMVFTVVPDALFALWLNLLADGVLDGRRNLVYVGAFGMAASAVATWYLKVLFDRVQRRFRDRVAIALEAHVATLQASVVTVEHHERPAYLDRLSVLRDQVFALDHLFLSLFSTAGWVVRLVVALALLASIHPVLILLGVFAVPTVAMSTWRPGLERAAQERVAPHQRLANHLFLLASTAAPGKEVRVDGLTESLIVQRREAWERWYRPLAAVQLKSAAWNSLGWAVFASAYVGAIVFVAVGLDESPGAVLLVLAAGGRLSRYVAAAVGELGFLRGIWLDSSRRLGWLEDYAAKMRDGADGPAPTAIRDAITFEGLSFSYPGTNRLVLEDVNLRLPAGSVVAIVGENGAGKSTLVKLLARMYRPTSGRIAVDGVDVSTISIEGWRQRLAGAFQDFFRFELPAQSSIGVGDAPRIDDRPAVDTAVGRAGAADVVERLAYGLDTQLGPTWDGGVEVSFGQWQKLALARGFMRDDPLVLMLDEPTAALDAETEHALFERFAGAARADDGGNGRITLLVSHRFSTVRMADIIVVLDGSRVAEVGSHDELMTHRGPYSELYTIQAAAYR